MNADWPPARRCGRFSSQELLNPDFEPTLGGSVASPQSTPTSAFSRLIRDRVHDQGKDWLQGAMQQGSRPGSPLHSLVYKLGKIGGHKFKPWEAVKWAKRLQGVVAAGSYLLEFRSQLNAIQREEAALQRRQTELRSQVRTAADALIDAAREEVAPALEQFYREAGRSVIEIEERLDAIVAERTRLSRELDAIRDDSRTALETIAGASPGAPPR
jgi:hypothetical protein